MSGNSVRRVSSWYPSRRMLDKTGPANSFAKCAIACYLNERAVPRRGFKFSTGSVYAILTATSYRGQHHFNRRDSRERRSRPPSQWVEFSVPPIVDEQTFNAVQGLLKSRNPKHTPPRVANGPTLLAGVARCGYCGAALIQNTGKGGQYRYYCCSGKLKKGPLACQGIRMRMDRLDEIVMGEILKRILDPVRLRELLDAYLRSANERAEREQGQIEKLRHSHRDVQKRLSRLLELVETGVMEAEDPDLKDKLIGLKLQRDELAVEIDDVQRRLATGEPEITPEKVERFAMLLREKLLNGTPEFRQAYARLLMREVLVKDREIRISGSKAALVRAASQGLGETPPAVLSYVREWRPRQDSNL
jgi:site-specific DNA recombinase